MSYAGRIELDCIMENLNILRIEGCMCTELDVNALTGMVKLVVSNCPKLCRIFLIEHSCPNLSEIQLTGMLFQFL